jgi:hypothetical protein
MLDPVTRLDPEVQRMTEQAAADYAYSLFGECEAVRVCRSRGIEPQYRPELVMMAKADEAHRKAHEDACAMAAAARAGVKVAVSPPKQKLGPKKSRLDSAVKHATKHGAELTVSPDGTMKFRPVSPANDVPSEPSDAWDQALGLKQ